MILYNSTGGTGLQLQNNILTFNGAPIRGSVWDLDGTMVDREWLYFASHVAVAEACGVHIDPKQFQETIERVPNFFGGPNNAIMEQIYALGNKNIPVEQMLKMDQEFFRDALGTLDSIDARPGVIELLTRFQTLGIPLAIASVTDEEDAMSTLEKSGTLKFFKDIILNKDVTHRKPDPEVYLVAMSRIGVSPKDCLTFEDSPSGTEAAVRSGAHVIAIPTDPKEAIIKRLMELGAHLIADEYVESFKDVIEDSEGTIRLHGEFDASGPLDGPGRLK